MLLVGLIIALPSVAQMPQMQQLPLDKAVRYGKLDNGLTYYIRQNDKPKGQADFYIAQNVGSMMEEENQRGLAHFLEHMCFNGTNTFPGNSMIDWLEAHGVKFGHDLNAYTGFDNTVYQIPNVPTADKGLQDTCLIILRDWADGLILDPAEIDKERGVIHEEWRRSMAGQMRILEKQLPVVYGDSKYGKRLPIGTMEVVDNFSPKALRDYYESWYRPDLQAVIVVGDIDPDYIEAKIKEVFSPVKMPENAKPRVWEKVADNQGTIYAIGSDKEMTQPEAALMFKVDNLLPREMTNTQAYYPVQFMKTMINMMLGERFRELNSNPDSKFASASASLGQFFISPTKDAVSIDFTAKGDDLTPAFKEAYRELLRAVKGGFTASEYDRAKTEFLSRIDKAYDNRNDVKNNQYVQEYVRNFTEGEPAIGIEAEKQIWHQLAQMLPLEAINSVLPEIVLNPDKTVKQDNRVFLAMLPENGTFVIPQEQELAAALAEVEAEQLEAFVDNSRTDPLVANMPKPGKIKSKKAVPGYDATEYTLSNGMKVVVKPTDFKENEIVMSGMAKGGTSTIADSKAALVKYLPYATAKLGLGTYNNADLAKYLTGKQASAALGYGKYSRTASGNSTVKDLPTLMELIYMNFTNPNIDEKEFEAFKGIIKTSIANQEKDPQFVFQQKLSETLFASPKQQFLVSEDLDKVDAASSLALIKELSANPADFTLYFVGNIDPATFEPLMEQYIASIPTNPKKVVKSVKYDQSLEAVNGTFTKNFTTPMETPQTWTLVLLSGNVPYTGVNKAAANAASQILSNRLLKKIREEMGATYSVGAYGGLSREGGKNLAIQIAFPGKPELSEQSLAEINRIVKEMTQNVTEEELAPVREYLVKNIVKGQRENNEWAQTMSAQSINGVDTWLDQLEVANKLTVNDVMNVMKLLLDQNNYATILLNASESAAKE